MVKHLARARTGRGAVHPPPTGSDTAAASAVEVSEAWIQALMDARARALARPLAPPEPADAFAVVTFALGAERYAIETLYVREIVRLREYTPVPGAPAVILGVAPLRGEVLCLIDLGRLFEQPPARPGERARLIVLGSDRAEIGIPADDTFEIVTVRPADILAPLASAQAGREYLRGVTREGLIVLDGGALLREPDLRAGRDPSPPAA